MKKFEIGKEYRCTGLYGGEYVIKIIDRTENTISYKYDEQTSDDRSVQVAEITIQSCTVYDAELNEIDTVDTETVVAWKYHSQFAEPDEYDYGYYFAFDNNRFYTPEEWEAEKNSTTTNSDGYTIKCTGHTYITLEHDGKFIFCLDNDMMKAEEMIHTIEKRTRMNFRDIPIKGNKDDFKGLRFFNGGWKRDFWNEFPDEKEIKAYMNLKRGVVK